MIQTLDELRALTKETKGMEDKPFVLINREGREYQAYWLDVWLGAFVVPEITKTQAFNIHQLHGKGCTARELNPGEEVEESVARALEARTQG